jgi:hypothetical protein
LRAGVVGQHLMNGWQFFLYEIVARIVAIYLCFDCWLDVRAGFVERKIRPYSPDFLDMFNPWSNRVAHRDTAPVQYWMLISVHIGLLAACAVVAIFGWWRPNT